MDIKIIKKPISKKELIDIAKNQFGDLISYFDQFAYAARLRI